MGKICPITSDSAQCCQNARKALTDKYPKLVGVQDQAHVANLCIQDIGNLPWVKEVLSTVEMLTSECKQKVKLRARLKDAIGAYNKGIRPRARMNASTLLTERAEVTTDVADAEGDERSYIGIRGLDGQLLFPALPSTAIILRKPAKTRFASIESTLEAYLRTRVVLLSVVQDLDVFGNLWSTSNGRERAKRAKFISTVESREFLGKVQDIHRVFRLLRRYLRVFDSDEAKISDVVAKTIKVGLELQKVPITSFLTSAWKQEVIHKFTRRQNGPLDSSIKVRLLEDIHFAAHLLDPHRCPGDIGPFLHRFRSYLAKYCLSAVTPSASGAGPENDQSDNLQSRELRQQILEQFVRLSGEWRNEKDDAGSEDVFKEFERMPLFYWQSLAARIELKELREFAMRTMSISPSSCAAERSFSMQGRIRTLARNRLCTDKVKKLAFTHWNMKLLGDAQIRQENFWRSVKDSEEEDEGSEGSESDEWEMENGDIEGDEGEMETGGIESVFGHDNWFEDDDDDNAGNLLSSRRSVPGTTAVTTSIIYSRGTASGSRTQKSRKP